MKESEIREAYRSSQDSIVLTDEAKRRIIDAVSASSQRDGTDSFASAAPSTGNRASARRNRVELERWRSPLRHASSR